MNERTTGFGLLGVGVAACAVCCAGPTLAFLGGLSLAGLVSTLVLGAVGIVVAIGAAVALLAVVQHRRSSRCSVDEGPVSVSPPGRR